VTRSLAFDARRHFAIAGRYPGFLGRPDSWGSWYLSAVPRGMRLIRRFRPDLLWVTFPIATAARIGVELARRSGLPLVCDLRDPMTEDGFPEDPRVRSLYRALEERDVAQASRIVFTAPGTLEMYRARYPAVASDHWHLIGNGYDERDFSTAATRRPARDSQPGRLELLHSGIVYPLERDPRPMFAAIAALKRDGTVDANSLRVTLRASGHDAELQPLIDATGIGDVVKLAEPLPYHDALAEMSQVDGCCSYRRQLQSADTGEALRVPAAQRPILARPTHVVIRPAIRAGRAICDLADVESIRAGLREFCAAWQLGDSGRRTCCGPFTCNSRRRLSPGCSMS
jgi:hypothetical protein